MIRHSVTSAEPASTRLSLSLCVYVCLSVKSSSSVRNLGMLFDTLSFESHIYFFPTMEVNETKLSGY